MVVKNRRDLEKMGLLIYEVAVPNGVKYVIDLRTVDSLSVVKFFQGKNEIYIYISTPIVIDVTGKNFVINLGFRSPVQISTRYEVHEDVGPVYELMFTPQLFLNRVEVVDLIKERKIVINFSLREKMYEEFD